MSYTLYHAKGCGSLAVLATLKILDIPHKLVELDYEETSQRKNTDSPAFQALIHANPLAQFPTLVTEDGTVLTEIAACLMYIVQRHGAGTPWSLESLTPSQLAKFYRWMVFIPANIYPLITIEDFPSRFVEMPTLSGTESENFHDWIKKAAIKNKKERYIILEKNLGQTATKEYSKGFQFVLGTEVPSVLDIFVTLILHYAPHPRTQMEWAEENCPGLCFIAKQVLKVPVLKETFVEDECTAFVEQYELDNNERATYVQDLKM